MVSKQEDRVAQPVYKVKLVQRDCWERGRRQKCDGHKLFDTSKGRCHFSDWWLIVVWGEFVAKNLSALHIKNKVTHTGSMRFLGILGIFSILVSMALVVVIFGQYKVMEMLNKGFEDLESESKNLEKSYINEESFKGTLEKLLVRGTKVMEDLEGAQPSLSETMAKKETETDACQAEKKTKTDELLSKEKEHADTEALLKTEIDAWTQEINTLKKQLTEFRPICHHVKNVSAALNLCGKKTS